MSQDLLQQAIECFGAVKVSEVIDMVSVSDPDCMYTLYQDMNMDEHAECVEFLFFG